MNQPTVLITGALTGIGRATAFAFAKQGANLGRADQSLLDAFFAAGWSKENMIDTIVIIGDKTVSNYLHAMTQVPVDFPAAPALV